MNAAAVADVVRRGDPDRFHSARSATAPARRHLHALYAFNVEVSRAAWVAGEAAIASIRLQWWAETIESIYDGRRLPAHDVALELASTISSTGIPQVHFDGMIDARRIELAEPDQRQRHDFHRFIDMTAGNLMWLAALALGAPDSSESTVRDFAWGAGVASYIRAFPQLAARGRALIDPDGAETDELLRQAVNRIRSARSRRQLVPASALPAMLAGWRASSVLRKAIRNAQAIASGELNESEFRRRGVLAWRSTTGLW